MKLNLDINHYLSDKDKGEKPIVNLFGEVIEVKGSYHSFQSYGKLRDNSLLS